MVRRAVSSQPVRQKSAVETAVPTLATSILYYYYLLLQPKVFIQATQRAITVHNRLVFFLSAFAINPSTIYHRIHYFLLSNFVGQTRVDKNGRISLLGRSQQQERKLAFSIYNKSMEYSISIYLLAFVLLLTPTTEAACLSLTQLDGLCSACKAGQTLLSGYCVTPMPGCQTQISQNMCGTCLTGYLLVNHGCLAVGSDPSVGAGAGNVQSYLQIYSDSAPDFRYELLDLYFKSKYATQLIDKVSNLSQLVELKTTYGSLYSITYANPYSNVPAVYKAEALVDYFNNITQYAFVPATSTDYLPLWFIDRKVIVEHLTILREATLNKVQQFSSNDYRLFYLNFRGEIWVIDIQRKANPNSTFLVFLALTQLYYEINENTVINYVFSQFPNLQLHTNYTVNYYSIMDSQSNLVDYFKFIFDAQIIVIIEIKGLVLNLYSYEEPDNLLKLVNPPKTTTTTTTNSTALVPGGYMPFLNLNDTNYLKVYNFLITQYPILINKNVVSVRYQIVAGINFLLFLNNFPFADQQYIAIVFQPLGTVPLSISSLFRNGIDIRNTLLSSPFSAGVFNYEADVVFRKLYTYFKQAASPQISVLLPISSVKPFLNANGTTDYLVFYNPAEFAILRNDPSQAQPCSVLSYTVDGILIPLAATLPAPTPSPTRTTLISFLKTSKPSLFTTLVVIRTKFFDTSYQLDLLTQYGTYFTRLHRNGLLYLSVITSTSDAVCADLDSSEFTANTDISILVSYVITNYSQLAGFTLTLIQGFISAIGVITYRMLFANQSGGRYQVQIGFSGGKFMVNKITSMGGGGCDTLSVIVGGVCQRSCQLFVF